MPVVSGIVDAYIKDFKTIVDCLNHQNGVQFNALNQLRGTILDSHSPIKDGKVIKQLCEYCYLAVEIHEDFELDFELVSHYLSKIIDLLQQDTSLTKSAKLVDLLGQVSRLTDREEISREIEPLKEILEEAVYAAMAALQMDANIQLYRLNEEFMAQYQ
jgi:hypothetical protein